MSRHVRVSQGNQEPKRAWKLVHKEGRVAVFHASDEEIATGMGSVLWCPVENVNNDWLDCMEQWGGSE
jgi:hypothetical protein